MAEHVARMLGTLANPWSLSTWLVFGIVTIAAGRLGVLFPKARAAASAVAAWRPNCAGAARRRPPPLTQFRSLRQR
jgi:hypothetical protein